MKFYESACVSAQCWATSWLDLINLIVLALNKAAAQRSFAAILSETVARCRRVDPCMHAMIDYSRTIETFLRQILHIDWACLEKYLQKCEY